MADRDIPEEMVEKATQALRDAGFVDPDDDTVPTFAASEDVSKYSSRFDVWVPARDAVIAVLSAALAGRQVVDLPEPDVRREQLDGAVDVWNIGGWSVTANADRVAIVTGRDGVGDGLAFYADRARKIAAALIAGAERLDRAAGSGSGED